MAVVKRREPLAEYAVIVSCLLLLRDRTYTTWSQGFRSLMLHGSHAVVLSILWSVSLGRSDSDLGTAAIEVIACRLPSPALSPHVLPELACIVLTKPGSKDVTWGSIMKLRCYSDPKQTS